MQKQTLWTANRQVFLFPELYLVPSLRDDKTDLYQRLEASLQQQDANPRAVTDAIQSYLFNLDQRANLRVEGIFDNVADEVNQPMHFVAKARTTPYLFFYRTYSLVSNTWTPWLVCFAFSSFHRILTDTLLGHRRRHSLLPCRQRHHRPQHQCDCYAESRVKSTCPAAIRWQLCDFLCARIARPS